MRLRIGSITSLGIRGENAQPKTEIQQQITQLGLDFHLMTQFPSFVAVEERVITTDGRPRTVQPPVEMPEGASYESAHSAGSTLNPSPSKQVRHFAGHGSSVP